MPEPTPADPDESFNEAFGLPDLLAPEFGVELANCVAQGAGGWSTTA